MSEYNDSLNHIRQILEDSMRPIHQSQKAFYDSMSSFRSIQSSVNEMMKPYQKLSKEFSKPFNKISQSISEEMAKSFKNSFDVSCVNRAISCSIKNALSDYYSTDHITDPKTSPYDFLEDLGGLPDDDFVTVDESSVKEYEIPDTIAIPIGNKRVRIKTEFFVSLLVTIILWFSSAMIDSYKESRSSQDETEYRNEQLRIEKEQLSEEEKQSQIHQIEIQILNDLLQSVDASNSTQTELIHNLKESVQDQNSHEAEVQ